MNTASTTAWALHDLGLATSFGGSLFGRLALHPSVGSVSDPRERGVLVHEAWRKFNRLNLLGHVLFAGTWLVGRRMLSGREVDRTSRALVAVKDGLVAASLVSGVTSIVAGERGMVDPPTMEPAPMNEHGHVAAEGSRRAKNAEKVTLIAGVVNTAAIAGILGVTAVLAMRSGRSSKWSLVSRLLP